MIRSHRHLGQAKSFDDAPCQVWMRIAYMEARRSSKRYRFLELDDLRSAALYGLAKAMREYDGKSAKPLSFAITCMRYAILEYVRSTDNLGRHVRDQISRGEREMQPWEELPISLYQPVENTGDEGGAIYLYDKIADPAPGPEEIAATAAVWDLVAALPEREATVIALHFAEGLQLKEISPILGVSDSRVSQLRNQGLGMLREEMSQCAA